jgi:hypothetical protein
MSKEVARLGQGIGTERLSAQRTFQYRRQAT